MLVLWLTFVVVDKLINNKILNRTEILSHIKDIERTKAHGNEN